MKILIDINHPAHVHYFRNFIKDMEKKGHRFCVINRDDGMINKLLDYYGIKHTIRNKRPKKPSTLNSLNNLMKNIAYCIWNSIKFRPDMYMGFASSSCAITSRLFMKPCVLMDDTEHNVMNHKLYLPCCTTVLTPFYFNKDFNKNTVGGKQIRFNAFVEQLYLHSEIYEASTDVLKQLNVKPREYVLVRYISYDAHHDLVANPLDDETKKEIVIRIASQYKVFVSLESSISDNFYDEYKLNISPEQMHDVEANAKFIVTEGATMASECFVDGVPYLYLNPLSCGYINYQCSNYSTRAYHTTDKNEALRIIDKLIKEDFDYVGERRKLEDMTINPTRFLEWFIENYPQSRDIMKQNPNFQYKFK